MRTSKDTRVQIALPVFNCRIHDTKRSLRDRRRHGKILKGAGLLMHRNFTYLMSKTMLIFTLFDFQDRKMVVNYYSRVRWILNMMPLLEAASKADELSRVITVLAAGSEGDVRLDDLELKHNFTLHACLAHCVVMTDFVIEELSRRYPGTSFSHSYPGTVKTGIANELSGPVRLAVKLMYAVMTPWIINVQESGERHYFQMTSQVYPAAQGKTAGIPPPEGMTYFKGMDGTPGGGAYLLDWDGKTCGDESVLRKYRELNMGTVVWDHTMKMFAQAEQLMRKSAKRPASDDLEGVARHIPDPIGWRPGS